MHFFELCHHWAWMCFFVFLWHLEMPGEYLLVMGESANSNPLWKQTAGKFWLYSGLGGCLERWRAGMFPWKTNGIWRAQQNSEALAIEGDPQWLCWSHFLFPIVLCFPTWSLKSWFFVSMNCLTDHVCEESKHSSEAPENRDLVLVIWSLLAIKWADMINNSLQMCPPPIPLDTGTNGLWIIGGNGAKRKNFECARGVIYSSLSSGKLQQ